jgi:putative SOS response-associated peptidase YedK
MCGRFALSKSDRIDWAQFGVRRGPALPPHWNLGPGRPIAVVRDVPGGAEVAMLRWGLVPFWAKDPGIGSRLANARAESVGEKPAFRAAFQQRRCLILADGFYEWQAIPGGKRKQPWFVRRADAEVFALAGLWERWQARAGAARTPPAGDASTRVAVHATEDATIIESCTILTMEPNALMAPIHGRMPVIIDPSHYAAWLSAETAPDAARALMSPWDPAQWSAYRVSTRVNAVGNDDAACVVPLADDDAAR